MKVLMISSYLPYPLHSGGQVRLYNLIRELSENHEITLICEKRSNQTQSDINAMKKICKEVVTVERKKQWRLSNIINAGFSTQSFLVTGHTTQELQEALALVLAKEQFDLIHIETYYVMQNLVKISKERAFLYERLRTIPVVLVEHNIEYQVYEKFRAHAPAVLRPLLTLDIAKIKREEEHFWKVADAVVAVSHEDQKVMEKKGLSPFLVSNGVNTQQFVFKTKEKQKNGERKLLFLGDFKWIQNKDSVTFIIKEIWPLIKGKTDLKLWIVGRKIPDSIRQLTNDPDVLFDEMSSILPTEQIFQEASILLAPIRIGGGTSYKILEAMSSGTPVVTMPLSAEAIKATDQEQIMVGKTAQELAEKTVHLLTDTQLYEHVAKKGRQLIEEQYTWKEIGKKLDHVYHDTVKHRVQ